MKRWSSPTQEATKNKQNEFKWNIHENLKIIGWDAMNDLHVDDDDDDDDDGGDDDYDRLRWRSFWNVCMQKYLFLLSDNLCSNSNLMSYY